MNSGRWPVVRGQLTAPRLAAGAMTAVAEPEPSDATIAAPPREKKSPRERSKPKRQPPYAVVLHNDDVNGFDFVMGVLRKVFHYARVKAFKLTLTAHATGRSIVWSGMREVAELKADQVRSCGPDPAAKASGALSLRVTLEALPQ